jgi:hypothetical protein
MELAISKIQSNLSAINSLTALASAQTSSR